MPTDQPTPSSEPFEESRTSFATESRALVRTLDEAISELLRFPDATASAVTGRVDHLDGCGWDLVIGEQFTARDDDGEMRTLPTLVSPSLGATFRNLCMGWCTVSVPRTPPEIDTALLEPVAAVGAVCCSGVSKQAAELAMMLDIARRTVLSAIDDVVPPDGEVEFAFDKTTGELRCRNERFTLKAGTQAARITAARITDLLLRDTDGVETTTIAEAFSVGYSISFGAPSRTAMCGARIAVAMGAQEPDFL